MLSDLDPFDAALVARAQTGDAMALQALLTSVRAVVLGYSRSRLHSDAGGPEAADDVAQETCLALLGVLPGYQHQAAPFETFLHGIAAPKLADAERGSGPATVLLAELADQVEPAPNPEEQAVSSSNVRAVHDLLALLPDRTREVLLLRARGLGASAVGGRLGMTANAVRVAQHRGLARLRRLSEDSEENRELLSAHLRPAVPVMGLTAPC